MPTRTRQKIQLVSGLSDDWLATQEGKYLDHRHYNRVLGADSTDIFKPDGSPLLLLRRNALPRDVVELALPTLRRAGASRSEHRELNSAILGYYDKPECRVTSFTGEEIDSWGLCVPFIKACNRVFERELPDRYSIQREQARLTDSKWVIGETAFTTMTVNRWDDEGHDGRTRLHRDSGDLPEGFGVISIIRTGNYDGGYLVFPKYRVAVDLSSRDVLLCDVHEWHANAPIEGAPGWERIATILYYRTAMRNCPATARYR